MNIPATALDRELKKSLVPIYFISGDEPLLIEETRELITKTAQKDNNREHITITADNSSAWQTALREAKQPSLFSTKKIITLHLPFEKVSSTMGNAVLSIAENFPKDHVLIITANKIDAPTKKTKWFLGLDKIAVIVQVWPIESSQFAAWISERLKKAKLPEDPRLIETLSIQSAGNLLAAAQEIEKCQLLALSDASVEFLVDSISDHSRFNVFELVDSALAANSALSVRILERLKLEDVEPTIVLWSLARELRMLARARWELAQKKPFDQVMKELFVFPKRQMMVRDYLKRTKLPEIYLAIQKAAMIDRMIKGFEPGDVWDALGQLVLMMNGRS